jgi:hypothetical protein
MSNAALKFAAVLAVIALIAAVIACAAGMIVLLAGSPSESALGLAFLIAAAVLWVGCAIVFAVIGSAELAAKAVRGESRH